MKNEKVKRVQELRRSNAATPVRNKKKYTRKTKNKKAEYLKTYCDENNVILDSNYTNKTSIEIR